MPNHALNRSRKKTPHRLALETTVFQMHAATAKLILRDLINATVGFERLAEEVHKPSKSLHRMLSASGNPTMENLSAIFATIKKALHVWIETTVTAV